MAKLHYGIAAYNEESRIGECLESLAVQEIDGTQVETIVCLNGCNDNTGVVVREAQKRYPKLNIRISHSKKGKVFAHNEIVRQTEDDGEPVAFVDGDVRLDSKAINILYRELQEVDSLQAVGGLPVPYRPSDLSLWESFLYEVLHARALFPQSEVSTHDVSSYKPFADTKPQSGIDPNFEKRSKIYFHGRLFMLRNKGVFQMPEDGNLADDSFLPNMIHTKYGPGSSRTCYGAIAYYEPYLSLRDHFNAYRRVHAQLRYLDRHFEEFTQSREMEQTKLDWDYIRSTGLANVARFAVYSLIRRTENALYRLLPELPPTELWK
ncbi:MAG: glycosyltransferase family A protein [Candidatus Aenigmatarchaeota archaeon]